MSNVTKINGIDMVQLPNAQGATEVHITHGGETVVATPAEAMEKAGGLIAKHGAGVPSFSYFTTAMQPLVQVTVSDSAPAAPVSSVTLTNVTPIRGSTVSTEGKIRSMIDFAEAEAAGFAPKQSIYERGTMVIDMGVSNAKRSRKQWEAMPLVDDYTNEFVERVAAEGRSDESVDAFALRMTKDGRIGLPQGERARTVTPVAFGGLTTRLGYGGATYLAKCAPEVRQFNFNTWGARLSAEREAKRAEAAVNGGTVDEGHLVLRTRNGANEEREIFGAVTDSYTAFDVDKVAEAFGLALNGMGARGRVTYDGNKARFEAIFHSNVQAEDYVAGEFFKAGLIVRTDDTGGGSIRGNATVWQNLCLNLIIIDRASQDLFRIRHIGSVEELAKRFRAGIEAGKLKLGHFLKAWGFANHDDVLAEARKVDADVPMRIEDALPGLFNGIIERELVLVKGRREENVKQLVRMYEADTSAARREDYLSRAAVVNAFTRFAHEVNSDPWAEDEIQRAAGGLLYGRTDSAKPAPLPWLPLDAKKGGKSPSPTFAR